MKFLLLSLTLLESLASNVPTTKWGVDGQHSKVSFSIGHFGISEIDGRFAKFNAVVLAEKADFSDAMTTFTIDVNNINTEDTDRDTNMKSPDFFDTANYPQITFSSVSMKAVGKNNYKLAGNLTMHGVTKPVVLDATYGGTIAKDPYCRTLAGFHVTGQINRKQWGLAFGGKLAPGDVTVSDELKLDCKIELIKQ